jgi:hypothetical protein
MGAAENGKIGEKRHPEKSGEIALGGEAGMTVTDLPEFSGKQMTGKCGDKNRRPGRELCPQR